MNKQRKSSKRLVSVTVLVIVVLGLGTAAYFTEKVVSSEIDKKIADVATPENIQQIKSFMDELYADDELKETISEFISASNNATENPDTSVMAENTAKPATGNTGNNSGASTQLSTAEKALEGAASAADIAIAGSVDKMVEQVHGDVSIMDSVSIADKVAGVRLATKLDVQYLLDLSKGGATTESRDKIKEHLKKELSQDEMREIFKLYSKYSYLLDQF